MRKYMNLVLFVLSFFLIKDVYALEDTTCSYTSKANLSKSAYNVDASYSIKKDDANNYYFQISLYNLTDDIHATIRNDVNNEEIIVHNGLTDNNFYSFEVRDITTIINYTITISAAKYGCNHELRKINLTKPRYNDLSELVYCKDDMMLDYAYCKVWITKYFNITREDAIENINEQYNKQRIEPITKCISCEAEGSANKKIDRMNMLRIAAIIGLAIGIFLDTGIIILLIIRLKRYDI